MEFEKEEELVRYFTEKLISGDIAGVGRFEYIVEEVSCRQGVADVVAVKKSLESTARTSLLECDSLSEASSVLALLKNRSPRTSSFLGDALAMPSHKLAKTVHELMDKGLVAEAGSDKYITSLAEEISNVEIWSFEAKLSNWKRALFQAAQHLPFATYSYIVIPREKRAIVERNIEMISRYGVGVIACGKDCAPKIAIKAKRNRNPVKKDKLYVLAKCSSCVAE